MHLRTLGPRLREQLDHPDPAQHAQAAELLLSLGEDARVVWAAARPRTRRDALRWLEQINAMARSASATQAHQLAALLLGGAPLAECAAFWMGARALLPPTPFFAAIGRPRCAVALPWLALPGRVFRMGARDPAADDWERPSHAVSLQPHEITLTPITRDQFAAMAPERDGGGEPAGSLGWLEAWLFAEWVGASLPTEAQWECACRASSDAPWSSGFSADALRRVAWFADNADGRPRPVATRDPNPWGIYDMHGNVMEWCADQQRVYHNPSAPIPDPGSDEQREPQTLTGAVSRVARGGYYGAPADRCRSSHRAVFDILSSFDGLGFRLVRPAPLH